MKRILIVLIAVLFSFQAFAQYEPVEFETPRPDWRAKLGVGGGLGLSFGTVTNVDLSPRVEYQIFNRLSAGVGGSYIYYNNKFYQYETSLYGLSAYTSFAVVKDLRNIFPFENRSELLLHFEANWMNLSPEMDFTAMPPRTDRFWLFQPQVGIGFKMPFGRNSYGLLFILYNIDERLYSPYSNPIISYYLMF